MDETRVSRAVVLSKRWLLQNVVEEATWPDGALRTTLFEPFEILRHSNREPCRKEKRNAGSGRDLEVWLPRRNVNPPQYLTLTAILGPRPA
jgi:hypothetical protein